MSRHLVTGVSGQDGTLLVRLLVAAGHEVIGTSLTGARSAVPDEVVVAALDITDTARFARLVDEHVPDVVHNLAGQSSVGQSWHEPELSDRVNRAAVLGMLDVLAGREITFVQASSAEVFGSPVSALVTEATPLAPQSPYAEAKAAAHQAVAAARVAGLRASNLVLFGHTSELQPTRFALPGICAGAAEVAKGERGGLAVQDPGVRRDWGSAHDHVRAFVLAAQGAPGDYVIGTGELTRLGDVVDWALAAAGVPDAPIEVTGSDRPTDQGGLMADYARARALLGWSPRIPLREEIARMVQARL